MRKKNKKLKIGLLGLGTIVRIRIANLLTKELKKNIEVISVFDLDKKKTEDFSNKFKCNIVKTEKEFFLKKFHFCYISTPSGNHFRDILNCFRYGKNVIVEKPPVLRTNQLIILNNISKKKKLKFFVIFQNRENRSVRFVKNYIKKNKKDKIVLVNLNLLWSRPQKYYSGWHGKWKYDGGVIAQQGIHYIDLLCYLFGKPIKAVSLTDNVSNKLQAEDTHIGLIKFKSVTCTIGLTTSLRPTDYKASIEIIRQNSIISLHGLACNKVTVKNYNAVNDNRLKQICLKNSENVNSGVGISHLRCFKKIIDNFLFKKNTKPLKAIDTFDTLKLINMLYLSSDKNRWVLNNKKNINSRLGN